MTVQAESAAGQLIESWEHWEGEAIEGKFALRRLLGRSDHSLSFLTSAPAQGFADATVKIVPVALAPADATLSNWVAAAGLSHPHLTRILDQGRCDRLGKHYLYVVSEYAEETLAEILPQRALTADEVKFLLPPVVDALTFLHFHQLAHGQIKPSNVMVVHDQVKLAVDTVQLSGDARSGLSLPSPYDPPEARQGQWSTAGDIWALGVMMVEALTQRAPLAEDESEIIRLTDNLPAEFKTLVERCLRLDPSERPTALELKAHLAGETSLQKWPVAPTAAGAVEAMEPTQLAARPAQSTPAAAPVMTRDPVAGRRRSIGPILAGAVIVLLVLWAGAHLSQRARTNPVVAAPAVAPPPAAQAPTPPATAAPAAAITGSLPADVLHEEMPMVAHSAAQTIHGRFQVVVRVTVNRAGDVMEATFEDAGPSPYFARISNRAAREWKFARGSTPDPRSWLLRFEFSRDGTTVRADADAP